MARICQIGDGVQARGELLIFEWNIKDFFSLSEFLVRYYVSPSFTFDDAQWYLRLYPNANSHSMVGLYLSRGDLGPPKTVNFTLGVKGSEESKSDFKYEFSNKDEMEGTSNFLSRTELRHEEHLLMPNNVLTVTCYLRSDPRTVVDDPLPASADQAVQAVVVGEKKLLKSLLSMLQSGADSDVVIKVRGKEFPAHKNILRARSDVFQSMFAHDMLEKNSGVVKIEDCDPTVFPDFLIHIYSGSCVLSSENVHSLYEVANKYNVRDLKEACSDFIQSHMSVGCFCHIIKVAVKHDDMDLIQSATNFFCSNSVDIADTAEWQTFMIENPSMANELFKKAMSNCVSRSNT